MNTETNTAATGMGDADDKTWGHVRYVYKIFKADLDQGYETADKKFAVELLGQALKCHEAALAAQPAPADFDTWYADPYTKVLMKSVAEDYDPRGAQPAPVVGGPELAAIGELIRTQDNRITSHPVFVVEQQRTIYAVDTDYDNDGFEWLDDEGIVDARLAARLEKLSRAGGDTGKYRRLGYKHYWEFVTACFTEQGCKDYLAANGHNLKAPRIYVYSAYRNAEWIALRALLAARPGGEDIAVGVVRKSCRDRQIWVSGHYAILTRPDLVREGDAIYAHPAQAGGGRT